MTTKEELLAYLQENTDTELPFSEDAWNAAFKSTKGKQRKFKEIKTTDYEGKEVKKMIPNGSVSPVSKYFQIVALPQYRKTIVDFEDGEGDFWDDDDEIDEYDDEKTQTLRNWINVFFDGFDSADKKFLKERLSEYYDTCDLNDGADKMLVIKAVADELEIMKLTKKRNRQDVELRLEKVQKGYLSILDSLKALKKQRGSGDDEGKNKLTLWIDELERQGEFIPLKDTTFEKDDIDNLLTEFEASIVRVFNEG